MSWVSWLVVFGSTFFLSFIGKLGFLVGFVWIILFYIFMIASYFLLLYAQVYKLWLLNGEFLLNLNIFYLALDSNLVRLCFNIN